MDDVRCVVKESRQRVSRGTEAAVISVYHFVLASRALALTSLVLLVTTPPAFPVRF